MPHSIHWLSFQGARAATQTRRHIRVFLRGGPAEAELSSLLFLSVRSGRRQRCWVQHNLGAGSLVLQRVASGQAWVAGLLPAAESSPFWGTSKRLQSWSAWAGSVALPVRTSVQLWIAQRSPLLKDQTGQWGRPGSRGRGFYQHPSSLSGLTTGGCNLYEREGWGCSLKRKRAESTERRDSYQRSGDLFTVFFTDFRFRFVADAWSELNLRQANYLSSIFLNSDFIHNNFCFYNVWIYPRSHSATRIIRAACYRKFYFDFPESAISL